MSGVTGQERRLRVLVACEFSGTVREAFRNVGIDATSCDLLDTEKAGRHWVGDVRKIQEQAA